MTAAKRARQNRIYDTRLRGAPSPWGATLGPAGTEFALEEIAHLLRLICCGDGTDHERSMYS